MNLPDGGCCRTAEFTNLCITGFQQYCTRQYRACAADVRGKQLAIVARHQQLGSNHKGTVVWQELPAVRADPEQERLGRAPRHRTRPATLGIRTPDSWLFHAKLQKQSGHCRIPIMAS